MAWKGKTFLRVLRAYNIEEKVVSLVLAAVVIVLLVQSAVDIFKRPELFAGEGGYYTEGLLDERPVVLNPVYTDLAEANREISGLIFSGLTRYDPILKAFVQDLADLSISEDGTTYTFTVKNGIKWHDGESLTAQDVYFTYHDVIQSKDFQNPVLRANFEGVEIKLVDDRTIEFDLSKSNSFFITNLNVGILPEHLLSGIPVAELPQANFNVQPVGTGPYMVDSPLEVFPDGRQRLLLTLNDDYYGEKPKIKNIRFHVYPDGESMLKEIGTLNIISKVPKDVYESIKDSERFSFLNYELPQYTAVFLNMDSTILKKDKVRIALQKAIDKDQLLKIFSDKTAVDTPLMSLDQTEWIYKPNPEEARGALYDSGYRMNENDESDPYRKDTEGENLKFVLLVRQLDENPAAAAEIDKTVDFLVDAWKQVGIEVEAQFEIVDTFNQRIKARDYDLLLTGESLGYNFDTYAYWHSGQAGENGLNLSNYKSFTADSLIEKVRGTFDNDEKDKYLQDLAKTIATDVPAIFLYRPSYIFATDNKVKGISLMNLAFSGDRFAGIVKWCILCDS
ncbi:hypothetical protein KJ951_00145 [Patescibacteria group bacterium]|nr:hypothetical protein [Patescibacteria group bacterium]MBU1702804.1 hypothetical protein [Patescibacteria group bacterium]MBU1953803.1 hypothetical protein [Patescibacteria group bacterium]